MVIQNRSLLLYGPLAVSLFLFAIPYCFYGADNFFYIRLKVTLLSHIFIASAIILAILVFFFAGAALGQKGRPVVPGANGGAFRRMLVWTMYLVITVYVTQIIFVGPNLAGGDFLSARKEFDYGGVGIPLRLHLIIMPLLFLMSSRTERPWGILWTIVILSICRSVIMSERLAMIEAIITLVMCVSIGGVRIRLGKLFVVGIAVAAVFSVVHYSRTAFLSVYDTAITRVGFGESMVAYYADTTNKFYLVLDGDFVYPTQAYMGPFRFLYQDRSVIKAEMNNFLAYGSSAAINPSLNNPGGFASDVSDLGPVFGLALIAFKYFMAGFVLTRAFLDYRYFAIFGIVELSILEMPRFVYIYTTFGFYLLLIGLLMIAFLGRNVRSVPERMGSVGRRRNLQIRRTILP